MARSVDASAELRAQGLATACALGHLDLGAVWEAAAAAVPLLAAGALGRDAAESVLGPEFADLAAAAAALPEPRVAAAEAVSSDDRAQAERLRALFLGLVRDVRIVPLLLARALARLDFARAADPGEQPGLAREALALYAPLAGRLGLWPLKWRLEDAAFRLADPKRYAAIAAEIAARREQRETRLAAAEAQLQTVLAAAGITARVSGRPKHLYSIWRKLQRKDRGFAALGDLMGLRVVVPELPDCYTALGAIHARWSHVPEEFDDYIAAPKPNRYRSLHTVVTGLDAQALEIQVRSESMDRDAELGVAAHWRYKEGTARDPAADGQIDWLRRILAAGPDGGAEARLVERVATELARERVYTLTPRGRVVDLVRGATPVDFAYAVHTSLGHRTAGAKVNSRLVPLTRVLVTGDIVEILTRTAAGPSRDWLRPEAGYVKTARARAKLRAWFREREPQTRPTAPAVVAHPSRARPSGSGPRRAPRTAAAVVAGMPELVTDLAGCCAPRAGHPVAAFVTRGRGIRIHRRDCGQFQANAQRAPGQALAAHWAGSEHREPAAGGPGYEPAE